MVSLTLRVLARPGIYRLPEIFTSLGLDYDEKVRDGDGDAGGAAAAAAGDAHG
jgi:prohibitin 1